MLSITKPKISIIIPVYNSSKYIRECLDTLCNQTLRDIEIICVDDGSTDNSTNILDEYSLKDKRIHVLKQENKGAGTARNLGLSIARGKYLSFLDSDDFFYPNMLECAYIDAEKHGSDITIFSYNKYFETTSRISKRDYGVSWWSLPQQDVFSFLDTPDTIFDISTPCPWNKLFRRQFVLDNHLQFQEIPKCNDLYFVYCAFYFASKISVIGSPLMAYRVGLESSLQSNTYRSPCDIYHALSKVHDRLMGTQFWYLVEKGFANVSLWQCVFQLDRLVQQYQQQYTELLSLLVNGGFDELGISAYNEEDFLDKWIFWKYKNYISRSTTPSSNYKKISDRIVDTSYHLRFYFRHLLSLYRRIGFINTIRCLFGIIYDSLRNSAYIV